MSITRLKHLYIVIPTRSTSFVNLKKGEITMWTTPAATEMRFGFEVTMYVMNK